jgi:U2 small nuclear ribonucleoprotein A'
MRLTVGLISQAPLFYNAIKLREIDLRNNGIPSIENLALIPETVEVIDLSGNQITKLEGLSRHELTLAPPGAASATPAPLRHLKVLLLSNNLISKIDADLIDEPAQLASLTSINLSGNKLAAIEELAAFAQLPQLRFLTLTLNPLTTLPDYRLRIIALLPRLKWLDFQKITAAERKAAHQLAQSPPSGASGVAAPLDLLPADTKQLFKLAVAQATSVEQLIALENAAFSGRFHLELPRILPDFVFPSAEEGPTSADASATATPSAPAVADAPASAHVEIEPPPAKRPRRASRKT